MHVIQGDHQKLGSIFLFVLWKAAVNFTEGWIISLGETLGSMSFHSTHRAASSVTTVLRVLLGQHVVGKRRCVSDPAGLCLDSSYDLHSYNTQTLPM